MEGILPYNPDTTPGPPKRTREEDETSRKRRREEAQRPLTIQAAVRRLSLAALPRGAMILSMSARERVRGLIGHARAGLRDARTRPKLPTRLEVDGAEQAEGIRQALASIADRADTAVRTCSQRTGGRAEGTTPRRTGIPSQPRAKAGEERRTADISELEDMIHSLGRKVREIKAAEEEREVAARQGEKNVAALQAEVDRLYRINRDLEDSQNAMLRDVYDIGEDCRYIIAKAHAAGELTCRLIELIGYPDAPPAAVVLEQLLETVLQELDQHLRGEE